jgi:hypothetical protein
VGEKFKKRREKDNPKNDRPKALQGSQKVPPPQYFSNEYQYYGVSIEFNITNNFLHSDFGDKCRPPSFKRVK